MVDNSTCCRSTSQRLFVSLALLAVMCAEGAYAVPALRAARHGRVARKQDLNGHASLFDIRDQWVRQGPALLDGHAFTGVCAGT
jgi:hypothetical protein